MSKVNTEKAFVLKDWQSRVLSERDYLRERLDKLEIFLESFASKEGLDLSVQGLSYLDLRDEVRSADRSAGMKVRRHELASIEAGPTG